LPTNALHNLQLGDKPKNQTKKNHSGRFNAGPPRVRQQYLIKWLAFDPFDLSKCRECEYLPLCSGGCPEYYYQGKHKQSNRLNCITWRYNLDDTLREYYQAWQKKQESEVNQI